MPRRNFQDRNLIGRGDVDLDGQIMCGHFERTAKERYEQFD